MPNLTAKTSKSRIQAGFTLVEMLIAISLISILAAMVYSMINYTKHRQNADDSIRRANLVKLVNSLETYRTAENRYPSDPNTDGNPTDDPDIGGYIKNGWINDEPVGATYRYWVNAGRTSIGIVVTLNAGSTAKYVTQWGQIRTCSGSAVPSDVSC